MGGNICRKVAEPVEQEEQVPDCCCATETGENVTSEKTNRIMLQYDKADADKLTYFGAKLSTNSEGEHRLVEVKEDGLAQQLHLKNDDVIIELNGADVTDVRRESLLLSLRDLGTKVQFVVNRRNEGKTPEQGRVYFRLEPPEGDAGSGEAHIAKEMHEFINDESSPCMRVTVKDFVLPQTDAFRTLGVYSLDEAKTITLQITKGSEVKELHISRSRAQFKPCAANVCMYKYQQVYFESRTITAYASVPNGSQYGITFDRTGNGTLHVEKTNRIMLQYDEADADKLTSFGAKLTTNSEGEHRLVEVEEDGLAKQLSLKLSTDKMKEHRNREGFTFALDQPREMREVVKLASFTSNTTL